MKKLQLLMGLAAGLLLASCGGKGGSGNLEPDDYVSAAKKGFLGDTGAEITKIVAKKQEVLFQLNNMMHMDNAEFEMNRKEYESKAEKLMAEGNAADEAWNARYAEFKSRAEGAEIPTEIAPGVPLELVKPYTVTEFGPTDLSLWADVRFPQGNKALSRAEVGQQPRHYYDIKAVLIDGNDNVIDTVAVSDPHYNGDIAPGRVKQLPLGGTLSGDIGGQVQVILERMDASAKLFATKRIILLWEHPTKEEVVETEDDDYGELESPPADDL